MTITMELSRPNNYRAPFISTLCFASKLMAPDECTDKSDSIDAKQEPLMRLRLSHSKAIEKHSLYDGYQIPRHRLNQCIEGVDTAVSWDDLTGRK